MDIERKKENKCYGIAFELPIELGRHARPIISHDDRLCLSCSVLRDERHYLLCCEQLMDVKITFLERQSCQTFG